MLIKSLFAAISTYSAIPVPQFEWDRDNTRYALCFFPVVGLFIAVLLAGLNCACRWLKVGTFLFAALACCLPVLVSGGIHMDGFIDTMDALASHQGRERKLEIMKDHHCGAFAVIYCVVYFALYLGLLSELYSRELIWPLCPGYVLSRALSGLCAVKLPKARKSGMLAAVTEGVKNKPASLWLGITAVLAVTVMLAIHVFAALAVTLTLGLWLVGYRRMCLKQFGGVTGDTAGFFLQVSELLISFAVFMGGLFS